MDRGRQHDYRALLSGVLLAAMFGVVGNLCAQGNTSPVPSVAVPPAPTVTPTPDASARRRAEVTRTMAERRQHDIALDDQEAQKRIDQLPPEEREAYKRNLRVWGELSPEGREAMRKEADERMRTQVEKAYQESGLHLDKDRREVFGLRYRQERRKLERELQEKLEAERAHRLPGIIDGLKRELADKPGATAAPALASATPANTTPASRPTPSVSVPTASR